MNKIKTIYIIAFFFFFAALFFGFNLAHAGPLDNVTYPIPELGNCGSVSECMAFCDVSENQVACIDWAASKKIVSAGEAKKVRDMNRKEEEFEPGPGGCVSPRECDAYCRVEENLRECMDYSVRKGYILQEEADGIIAKAEKGGPGKCKSKSECENFCKNPENADECFSFVADEGKITKEEAEFMKERMKQGPARPKQPTPEEEGIDKEKVQTILKEQAGPGGCKNMQECQKFCMDFNHAQECMEFAVKHQITKTPQDLERIKRISQIKSGPGGCAGQEECNAYCSKNENRDECFKFTKENQLMSEEEIQKMEKEMEIVKKLEGGAMVGPGGCKGPEECNAFCSNSANIEECINFGGQHGMLDKNTVQQMMGKTQEARQKLMEVESFKKFREMEQGGEFKNGIPEEFMKFGPPQGNFGPEGRTMPSKDFVPQEGFTPTKKSENMMLPEGFREMVPPEGFVPPKGFEKFIPQYPRPENIPPYPVSPSGSYPIPQGGGGTSYPVYPEGMPSYPVPPSESYPVPPSGSYPVPTNTSPSSFNPRIFTGSVTEAFSGLFNLIK